MTVYVDALRYYIIPKIRYNYFCHMVADTNDELYSMAKKIGLQKGWVQIDVTGFTHFDITPSKRRLAIQFGAKEISSREIVKMRRLGNNHG